jgi:two-component system response regulator YesN
MLHILIVDDEPIAVRGVKAAIDGDKLGISDVYTAYNAVQAKEIFNNHRIDIMICDIEMPQESGLDLLAWVKQNYPAAANIFLTCHADFSFAKQAIQLGSLDYLLKPIPPEVLETVLIKAIEKIRMESELIQHSHSWVQHHPLFIERFWLDIVHLVIPSNPDRIQQAMEERKISYAKNLQVLPVLIQVQRWHKPITIRDEKILEYGLKNAAIEMISELNIEIQMMTMDRNELLAVLLLSGDAKLDMNELKSKLELYISSCYRYFYCDLSCYIGDRVFIHELAGGVNRVLALKKNNVAYNNQVFLGSKQPITSVTAIIPDMKVWSVMLIQGSRDKVFSEVKDYLIKLAQNAGLDAPFMRQFHQDFLQVLYSFLREKGIQAHELFNDSKSMELSDQAGRSLTDMLEWLRHMVFRAINHVNETEESSSVVEKVTLFIRLHFDEDLSREHIASPFYLNPDYMDRMFKKEMGMSMKEYLLHERMRIAQEMLSKTDLPVTHVATQVGFNNLSHFTKVFRKHTSFNPSDYRQRMKK